MREVFESSYMVPVLLSQRPDFEYGGSHNPLVHPESICGVPLYQAEGTLPLQCSPIELRLEYPHGQGTPFLLRSLSIVGQQL